MIHVVPDTNFFLHYPYQDFDWTARFGEPVTLVVCIHVIDELDEKKSHRLFSERASTVLKDVFLRDGIKNSVCEIVVKSHASEIKGNVDSKVVAFAKWYADSCDGKVMILTEDFGMANRCKSSDVACCHLQGDKSRLPNPHDEFAKKHNQVVAELDAMKNRMPLLKVYATIPGSRGRLTKWDLLPLPVVEQDHTIEQIKEMVDGLKLGGQYCPIALDKYVRKCEKHFDNKNTLQELSLNFKMIVCDILIENSGGCPATEVEVEINFVNLALIKKEDFPEIEFPNLPSWQESWISRPEPFVPALANFQIKDSDVVECDMSGKITATFKKVLHQRSPQLIGSFFLFVMSNATNFEAAYTVNAAEFIKTQQDKILFALH